MIDRKLHEDVGGQKAASEEEVTAHLRGTGFSFVRDLGTYPDRWWLDEDDVDTASTPPGAASPAPTTLARP